MQMAGSSNYQRLIQLLLSKTTINALLQNLSGNTLIQILLDCKLNSTNTNTAYTGYGTRNYVFG